MTANSKREEGESYSLELKSWIDFILFCAVIQLIGHASPNTQFLLCDPGTLAGSRARNKILQCFQLIDPW